LDGSFDFETHILDDTVPPPAFACAEVKATAEDAHRYEVAEEACHCDELKVHHGHSTAWGCARHQVYPASLLLAHRKLSWVVAQGAPGLELSMDYETASESRGPKMCYW